MKKTVLFFLLCLSITCSQAQNISVKSFRIAPDDMTARVTAPVIDQNGDKCALIKVRTSQKGFVFEGDMNGITKTKQDVGEVWIYLPQKSRKITIKHQQLGVLDKYIYPEAIKEASVYIMELTCGKVTTIVEDIEVPTQWVVVNSTPEGVDVYFDEKYIGQTPTTKKMPVGKHTYRLEKTLYHNSAGTFELKVDNKYRIEETLKENFGFAHISTSPEDGAEISIDGQKIGKTTPAKTNKLLSGEYKLSIRKDLYKSVSRKIVIKDNETSDIKIVMEANFGSLDITTSPVSGVVITLDGKPLDKKTPYTLNKLASGEHSIKLHKEWYEPKSIKVNIEDGEAKQLPVILSPTFGELNVTTNPEADIYIDDKFVAKGQYNKRLIAGLYSIEARQDKHHPHKQNVEVLVGDNKNLELVPTAKVGTLDVNSTPFDANILINGKESGITPNTFRNLLVGEYQVKLSKAGYGTVLKTINISENQTAEINEILPSGKEVSITSKPVGARLSIDGQEVGATPYTATLAYGSHNIKLINGTKIVSEKIIINQSGKTNFTYDVIEILCYIEVEAGVDIEMIEVKGGSFQMGSRNEDDEKPIHSVRVDDFYIGKHEVTQSQWKVVMGTNPSKFKGDNLPVEQVSWNDVQTFITKLNLKTGKTYRLPTEAEWEYAARGGVSASSTTYAGSHIIGDVAWYEDNSSRKTHEVGGKQANELGIYDMCGNVGEWCNDWYKKSYYKKSPGVNPQGSRRGFERVYRGGSWCNSSYYCRVAFRLKRTSSFSLGRIGFRLARSL